MATPNGTRQPLDVLGKLWPILITLVMLASAWGVMQTQSAYHETRLSALETELDKTQGALSTIAVRLAEIQRDLQYIRTELDKR